MKIIPKQDILERPKSRYKIEKQSELRNNNQTWMKAKPPKMIIKIKCYIFQFQPTKK